MNPRLARHIALCAASVCVALLWAQMPAASAAEAWTLQAARGCVAARADGERVACVNITSGRAQLEIKHPKTRRLYRVELLGSDAAPTDIGATPRATWTAVVGRLKKQGFEWLEQGAMSAGRGLMVPGATCGLTVSADHRYLETSDARSEPVTLRPWLEVGPPGGKVRILSVARHRARERLHLVLEHDLADDEGPLLVRQFKSIAFAELARRAECAAAPTPPSGEPGATD